MFPPSRTHEADASIRLTDTDAAAARISAVAKGYLADPFIRHLVPRAALAAPPRPPLINVGTFVRSTAIDELVNQWLALAEQEGTRCQIVSIGAGSDTRFWRIAASPARAHLAAYVELDFPEVTSKKARAIRKSAELSALLGDPASVMIGLGGAALVSPQYHLLPVDLRAPPAAALEPLLARPSATHAAPLLAPALPTLLLCECVLVYMPPAASAALLDWFVRFARGGGGVLGGVVYEMFGLRDAFGRVMLSNLEARNVSLPGAAPYPDAASLPGRFLARGFTHASALTLRDIRRAYIPVPELERIAKLEMLDEIEELELVLQHYAITWGVGLFGDAAAQADWAGWGFRAQAQVAEEE